MKMKKYKTKILFGITDKMKDWLNTHEEGMSEYIRQLIEEKMKDGEEKNV